jgi:hypothetical protein
MGEDEINREIDKLSALISLLEQRAGITDAVNHARETGAPDKLRAAYYSVPDIELKKQLITTTGKLDRLYLQKCDQEVSLAKEEVSKAIEKAKKQPWHLSVTSSIGALIIGQWILGFFGAIAGAIGGFYLGQWLLASIKKENAREIEQAKHLLVLAQRRDEASKVDPFLFSSEELEACEHQG